MNADRNSGWLPAARVPDLRDGEIHVWCARLDGRSVAEDRAVLSDEEQARADRFRFDVDQRRFTVARASLRRLLAAYLNCTTSMVRFVPGPAGKPGIACDPKPDLQFNVSHSGGLALLAFARGVEVGVDVEFGRPDIAVVELANRFFSAREARLVNAATPGGTADAFYSIWTRKEACVKALGIGLGLELASFSVVENDDIADPMRITVPMEAGPCPVTVCGAPHVGDCRAALAWISHAEMRPAWLMLED